MNQILCTSETATLQVERWYWSNVGFIPEHAVNMRRMWQLRLKSEMTNI